MTSLVKFSVILLTLLVVCFTRLYSSIACNLVLVKRTFFGSFVFIFLCFYFSSLLQLILVVYAKVDTR